MNKQLLQKAKDIVAQKHEYADWCQTENTEDDSDSIQVTMLDDVAEQYAALRCAPLVEALEKLNKAVDQQYAKALSQYNAGEVDPTFTNWPAEVFGIDFARPGSDKTVISFTGGSPIDMWFELSRAQYLTVPRSVMQAMPLEWQAKMAICLYELDKSIDWRPKSGRYWCRLKDDKGRYVHDPLMNYRHPEEGAIQFFDEKKESGYNIQHCPNLRKKC